MHIILTFLHLILEFFYSILIAGIVLAAIDLAMLFGWLGNPRPLHLAIHIRRFMHTISTARPDTIFTCKANEVFATIYNARTDEESTHKVYRGSQVPISFMTWTGGPRAAARMKRAATSELILHLCFLIGFVVPAIAVGIWLAVAVNGLWAYALIFFLELQAVCAYLNMIFYFKVRLLLSIIGSIFAYRVHWVHNYIWFGIHFKPPPWLSITLLCLILYVPPLLLAWSYRDCREQALE